MPFCTFFYPPVRSGQRSQPPQPRTLCPSVGSQGLPPSQYVVAPQTSHSGQVGWMSRRKRPFMPEGRAKKRSTLRMVQFERVVYSFLFTLYFNFAESNFICIAFCFNLYIFLYFDNNNNNNISAYISHFTVIAPMSFSLVSWSLDQ